MTLDVNTVFGFEKSFYFFSFWVQLQRLSFFPSVFPNKMVKLRSTRLHKVFLHLFFYLNIARISYFLVYLLLCVCVCVWPVDWMADSCMKRLNITHLSKAMTHKRTQTYACYNDRVTGRPRPQWCVKELPSCSITPPLPPPPAPIIFLLLLSSSLLPFPPHPHWQIVFLRFYFLPPPPTRGFIQHAEGCAGLIKPA